MTRPPSRHTPVLFFNIAKVAAALALFQMLTMTAHAQDWDCSDPGNLPQQGMNYCAHQDYQAADADLNTAYKAARTAMRRTDESLPASQKGAADSLLRAQRAWITYRDAACETEGFSFRGGSMEPFIVSSCKAELTRQRTDQLRSLSETY